MIKQINGKKVSDMNSQSKKHKGFKFGLHSNDKKSKKKVYSVDHKSNKKNKLNLSTNETTIKQNNDLKNVRSK